MKIIEALKKVKDNRRKIADLQAKIKKNAARLNYETTPYENPVDQVSSWVQTCNDLSLECVKLLSAIAKTNLVTEVTIELGGNQVTRSITEWIYRRREFAKVDLLTQNCLTTGTLKEGEINTANGEKMQVTIIRHFNSELRDKRAEMFSEEPYLIDTKLELVNATTDIIENLGAYYND